MTTHQQRPGITRALSIALLLGAFHTPLAAKVSPEEAAQLGMPEDDTPLTPVGAERAGNADGSIPPWTGGITTPPPGYVKGGWYVDPYADDQPLFTIDVSNYKQYEDKLTPGTIALINRYPDTFTVPVYPTRRSAAYPEWFYEGSIYNATHAEWCGSDDPVRAERCLKRDSVQRGIHFPIPKTGGELLWNHTFTYWGRKFEAHAYGANAYANGGYVDVHKVSRWMQYHMLGEDLGDPYFHRLGGAMLCYSEYDIAPPRSAGQVFGGCNNWSESDFDAYIYVPGQRRVRKAPELGFYDSPGSGSDGLRTADQRLGWFVSGGEEWYEYLPIRKVEVFAPYNAYKMADPNVTFDDLMGVGHINPQYKRYELHRHWVVEGKLRTQYRHIFPHRRAFIDEDSWHVTTADMYDKQDQLWRVTEIYQLNYYDQPLPFVWGDANMDMQNGRYAASPHWHNIGNADGNGPPEMEGDLPLDYYTPAGLRRIGVR
ncbi:MAG: DUF1329 domain-containing protein [Pseudomonadota bacterium]|nr:DUF1329 domain-containing protein [Pseudomonadota bacterium]